MAHFSEPLFATAAEDRPKEHYVTKFQDTAISHPVEDIGQSSFFGSVRDMPVAGSSLYAPNSHTHNYKGYENFPGEWDDFNLYGSMDRLNSESPGIYDHGASSRFHNGYGYDLQMSRGMFSPVRPSLSVVEDDFPFYLAQQYACSGQPYHQQVVSPSMPYITSQLVSRDDSNMFATVDQRHDSILQGPESDIISSLSPSGRDIFPRNRDNIVFQDQLYGHRGSRCNDIWSDWPKSADIHLPPTVASQQPNLFCGFGSASISDRNIVYPQGINQTGRRGNVGYNIGASGGSWPGMHYGRQYGLGNCSLCSCCSSSDMPNEQNCGPRAKKSMRQTLTENYRPIHSNRKAPSARNLPHTSRDKPDFIIEYDCAKFFVIKSYSEDNIHKSIKYGVWASTPNGNQKLNTAYLEAKEKPTGYPVFLLFSVNASAQFCGVAEMVGPVDFEKSVDYWKQDKWSGQFPVKWHMIKDVPNSQFRHILLENNDNKPVTNSRDTQEVKFEQGVEMLNIFKKYETNSSILDDFDFYENRQKSHQERKCSRPEPEPEQARKNVDVLENATECDDFPGMELAGGAEKLNVAKVPNKFLENMSKSFAQVVRLKECSSKSDASRSSGIEAVGAKVSVFPALQTN